MNIVEYVKQCGDKPLTAANLREADTLVLTALSYPTLLKYYSGFDKDITLGDAASQVLAVTLQFREKKFRDFLIALSGSKRFNQLKICGYRDEFEVKECAMQFSAVTVKISDQLWFISYSGTDSTVAGWKEDFQFAYMEQTPAQLKALHYLEEAAGSFSGNFIISGHSKGGNLAAYAALFADERIQERIGSVFCDDAPGFNEKIDIFSLKGYKKLKEKIHCILPKYSTIGMLLETFPKSHFSVIRSEADTVLYQHDIFNWQVNESGLFYREKRLSTKTTRIMDYINRAISSMPYDKRQKLTDYIFRIFERQDLNHISKSYLIRNLPVELIRYMRKW